MDEVQMNRLLMQKVGRKFYGHDTLNSKYDPQIPASAEREYVRIPRRRSLRCLMVEKNI